MPPLLPPKFIPRLFFAKVTSCGSSGSVISLLAVFPSSHHFNHLLVTLSFITDSLQMSTLSSICFRLLPYLCVFIQTHPLLYHLYKDCTQFVRHFPLSAPSDLGRIPTSCHRIPPSLWSVTVMRSRRTRRHGDIWRGHVSGRT